MARAIDVEERDRMAVLPSSLVEAVTEARADGDRVKADVVVEKDVRPAHDALAERHAQVRELGRLDDLEPLELRAPGIDVLGVQGKERRDPVVERFPQALDDAA